MATSGWQNEQWIHTIQAEIYFNGNVRIDGITHTGNSLRVWGTIAFCARGTSGWSGWFDAGVYAAAVNQPDGQILGNGSRLYVGTDVYRNFDVAITVPASATTYNFSVRYHSEYFDKTLTWGLSFGTGGTAPTGITATLGEVGPDYAYVTTHIDSYGSPATSANRYIEAAILSSNSYAAPYRCNTVRGETEAEILVSNSGSGALTITPNTRYYYGGYASNTVLSTNTVGGSFVTLPAVPTITAVDQGHGVIAVTVSHASEGSAETVTEEFSTDGGSTWTTITGGTFTLNLSAQTVVTVRRSSSAGSSQDTVTVAPTFTFGIYASVINKTKRIEKGYVPVEGPRILERVAFGTFEDEPIVILDDEEQFVTKFNSIAELREFIEDGDSLTSVRITYYAGDGYDLRLGFLQTSPMIYSGVNLSDWGLAAVGSLPEYGEYSEYDVTATYGNALVTKKIEKVYASVNNKAKTIFEDV